MIYKSFNAKSKICLILIVTVLSSMLISCSMLYRKYNPYLDRTITGPLTLSSEWLEINPQEPLKPEREVNAVMLEFAIEYNPDYKHHGLRLEDGSVVTPEVQVIDQDGKVYALEVEFLDKMIMGFTLRDNSHRIDFPKDKLYTKLRIRCSKPIQCSRIFWRSYNSWDR